MNKWLVPDEESWSQEERAAYWEGLHRETDYDLVYSLTGDPGLRRRIVASLEPLEPRRIAIPGCGTRTDLQRHLLERFPEAEVVCTDFAGVVRIAATRFEHPRLTYVGGDASRLALAPCDAVVHVTSVVSESDRENRAILANTGSWLRAGGLMVGLFPTVLATLDLAYVLGEPERADAIDLGRSSYSEPKQGVTQIFYTPVRLRVILQEAGLSLERMEIFFNDSEELREQGRIHYGFTDPDAVLYHLYCEARRGAPPRSPLPDHA